MAKKIRKVPPQRKSMLVLFIELLIPWLVMGGAAVILVSAGMSGIPVFVIALGAALGATVFIRYYDKKRANLARTYGTSIRRR
jgi:NADPH:quinone reductase-like Zn-dependent oxidoreductase